MLGALHEEDPRINGLTGNESNPDTTGALIKVQPNARYWGQLDPDPDHNLINKGIAIEEQDNGIVYCIFFCNPDGHLLEFITYHPDQESDSTTPQNSSANHGHAHVPRCPCSANQSPNEAAR